MSDHENPMTKEESELTEKVIKEFHKHFAEEDGVKIELFEYNDDYVDLQVTYSDGYEESMAFERDLLTSGKTVDEIIYWIA